MSISLIAEAAIDDACDALDATALGRVMETLALGDDARLFAECLFKTLVDLEPFKEVLKQAKKDKYAAAVASEAASIAAARANSSLQ